jgi:hypothetical protein
MDRNLQAARAAAPSKPGQRQSGGGPRKALSDVLAAITARIDEMK